MEDAEADQDQYLTFLKKQKDKWLTAACEQELSGEYSQQFWVWDKIQTAGQAFHKIPGLCYRWQCKKVNSIEIS